MFEPAPVPFLRDPITTPREERIEHYRAQAVRYRQLAERQQQSSVREGLLDLAQKCDAMANSLATSMCDRGVTPELSRDDLVLMLGRVVDEAEKTERAAPPVLRRSPPQLGPARELSLDEILEKVQRDLAEGRPAV
jgi:hypothetical protein